METSYETICAVLRKAPKKAYFELLDHPDKITPYTPKDDTAKMNNKLKLILVKKLIEEKGIIDQPTKLRKKVKIGANIKLNVLEFVGITDSFRRSFNPSAIGCNNPRKPTEFGPKRCCIPPITFRSASVK